MKNRPDKKVMAIAAAAALLLGTAAVSSAYWTDRKDIHTEVSAMKLGIEYSDAALGFNEDQLFIPGDNKEFSFNVHNTGSTSVDIKPVITISSSKAMKHGGSRFLLADSNGQEITGYSSVYMDMQGNKVGSGDPYYKVAYTLSNEKTLSGTEHKDPKEGEVSDQEKFTYYLKLAEDSGNDIQEAKVDIDISTYAIQHRNRTNSNEEWIQIVVPKA